MSLGSDVAVKVNSVELTAEMGEKNNMGVTVFTLENLYSAPEVSITDTNGNKANYHLPDDKNGKIEFDNTFYTLTLPNHLFVAVDGQKLNGEMLDDGRFSYRIRLAKKANVNLSDLYGNTVQYTGASTVPLTWMMFEFSGTIAFK